MTDKAFAARLRRAGECLIWSGAVVRGYGQARRPDGSRAYAHRIAFESAHGRIPVGLIVRHACDTPLCCNPSHLQLGTAADNNADKQARGRQARGERNNSKLTAQQVRSLRADARSHVVVARELGVTPQCVGEIRRGKWWKHELVEGV